MQQITTLSSGYVFLDLDSINDLRNLFKKLDTLAFQGKQRRNSILRLFIEQNSNIIQIYILRAIIHVYIGPQMLNLIKSTEIN
jgi:hypothetical protein